ncbi:MAG: thioredoxin domain-containing protein [Pirellulales bacterium]|nr:thioredoxin domain-containing protein [Pirellulales bacterium]
MSRYRSSGASDSSVPGVIFLGGLLICSGAAFAAAAYLAWASLTGGAMAGCMGLPRFDCQHVLSSRWAYWFTIPVSLPGAAVYAAMFFAAPMLRTERFTFARRAAWTVLPFTAMLAAGAAAWFLGLMMFASEKFCLWCMVAHINGLIAAGLASAILFRQPKTNSTAGVLRQTAVLAPAGKSPRNTRAFLPRNTLVGLAAIALGTLVLGQIFGPRPLSYRVDALGSEAVDSEFLGQQTGAGSARAKETVAAPPSSTPISSFAPDEPRKEPAPHEAAIAALPPGVNELSNQQRADLPRLGPKFDSRAYPCIGEAGAKYAIVEMVDYCCKHCRDVHRYLQEARRRYGSQLAVVVLPVPMNTECNEYVPYTLPEHDDACRYARLAVAVWRLAPAKFPAFHDWLYAPEKSRPAAEAASYAAKLVGREALDRELAAPEVDRTIGVYTKMFSRVGALGLPKLVLGNYVISGKIDDARQFFDLLEKYLGLHAIDH